MPNSRDQLSKLESPAYRRRRLLAVLLVAGAASGGLGSSLIGAGAESEPPPVPGETVPAAPTSVEPEPVPPAPAPDPPPQAPETPPVAADPAPPPPAPAPAQPAPAAPAPAPAPVPAPVPPAAIAPPDGVYDADKADADSDLAEQCQEQEDAEGDRKRKAVAERDPAGKDPADKARADRDPAGREAADEESADKDAAGKGRAEQSLQIDEDGCREPDRKKDRKKKARKEKAQDERPTLDRDRPRPQPQRNTGGLPTLANPTTSLAFPGAAPVGVPNFFIDKFRIPPFLLPIYQAAGTEYGVRWEVLAAINEIETDYGRNLNVSSAGALGWMQFLPATWRQYGVDANRDGKKDPFNPVDAIFAAARYLKAAGAEKDLPKAIFAYNRADWYVDSVLMRARVVGGLPTDLVGSLSGLTQGRFPVAARARYADDISERETTRRVAVGENAANPIEGDAVRRGTNIFADPGSPVVAVQDGRIEAMGRSERLGRYIRMRDAYGNVYTYAHLKKTALKIAVPKERTQSEASVADELSLPARDPKPTRAASAGKQTAAEVEAGRTPPRKRSGVPAATIPAQPVLKERLFAYPSRARPLQAGGRRQIAETATALGGSDLGSYLVGVPGLRRADVELKPLVTGSKVIAGTILGRIGQIDIGPKSAHLLFEVRPAGRGAPRIDPKPILDGWKLLESTAIYRAKGQNVLRSGVNAATVGQILLMSKETLVRRVLSNPRIEVYSCGADDIRAGAVDRRVLATLEFLAASGMRPTVTSLRCGHGYYTSSGNVSAHSSGAAVDIAKINGVPILGNQGEGSITDAAVRRLLTLQGTMKPAQIISLMKYDGMDNTLGMADHADHIHVGFRPAYDAKSSDSRTLRAVLKPSQWIKLIDRIGTIENPTVRERASKYAIPAPVGRASASHRGE